MQLSSSTEVLKYTVYLCITQAQVQVLNTNYTVFHKKTPP